MSGVTVEHKPDGTSLCFVNGDLSVSVLLAPKDVDELVTKLVGCAEGKAKQLGDSNQPAGPRVRKRAERADRGASAVLPLIDAGVLKVGEVLKMRSGVPSISQPF